MCTVIAFVAVLWAIQPAPAEASINTEPAWAVYNTHRPCTLTALGIDKEIVELFEYTQPVMQPQLCPHWIEVCINSWYINDCQNAEGFDECNACWVDCVMSCVITMDECPEEWDKFDLQYCKDCCMDKFNDCYP